MGKPLLVNFGAVSCDCTDHALETLYKAIGDPPGDVESIWRPHHDPWIAQHIEDVTARGLSFLAEIRSRLTEPAMTKAIRWTDVTGDMARSALAIATKPRAEFTLDDWLTLIDVVLGLYLPDDIIQAEAEALAVRAVLAGRAQAALDRPVTDATAAALAVAFPVTVVAAHGVFRFQGRDAAVLDFARRRAADLITEVGENTRKRLRRLIVDHEERRVLGEPVTQWDLQSRMFDEFAILNRDWRRVAITEVGRDANEGFIASMPAGARVQRVEHYPDACGFCRRIHGIILTVVDPGKEDKDGWTEVWPGKGNEGRSASPRKRVGDELVERTESELWWPAAGVQHPHCRGTWRRVSETPPEVDPVFSRWLEDKLAKLGDGGA